MGTAGSPVTRREHADHQPASPSSAPTGDGLPDPTDPISGEPASHQDQGGRANGLRLPLALATIVLTYWCVDIASPALPDVQRSLALSGTGAGLVFAAFFGGRLLSNLPAAFLVDRVGPRPTAGIGATLLVAGSLLAAVATGGGSLLPARALQGTGVALLASAALLSVLRARPGGGFAMTAFNVAAGVGGSAGLVSGGALTGSVGWRAVFWLSAGLAAALVVAAVLTRPAAGRALGSRASARDGDGSGAAKPGRRALAGALLANLLVYGNYSVWVVSLPLYAADAFDADAQRIGVLLLVVNIVHLSAAVPAGRIIRRSGALRALVGGFAITAVGLALVLAAPSEPWLLAPMTLYAVGQVMGNSAAGDLLLRLGGGGGRAVGMVRLTSDVGLVAGPAAVGALADAAGTAAPFPVLAALTAVATWLAWRGKGRRSVG